MLGQRRRQTQQARTAMKFQLYCAIIDHNLLSDGSVAQKKAKTASELRRPGCQAGLGSGTQLSVTLLPCEGPTTKKPATHAQSRRRGLAAGLESKGVRTRQVSFAAVRSK